MGVYIDDMCAPYYRMKMAHMIADTHEELIAMADTIGLQRKWLQKPGTYAEHFDVCQSMQAKAVRNGAMLITQRELGQKLIAKRRALISPARSVAGVVQQIPVLKTSTPERTVW